LLFFLDTKEVSDLKPSDVINRLLIKPLLPTDANFRREVNLLNGLFADFPDIEFWGMVSFSKKFESFIAFDSGYWYHTLSKKYKEFSYKIKKSPKISIGKKWGRNKKYEPQPKNLKSFLS